MTETKTRAQIAAEKEALMAVEDVSTRKNNIKKYLTTLTAEQAAAFVAAAQKGVPVSDMAEVSDMSRRAIYNILSRHEAETGNRLVNTYTVHDALRDSIKEAKDKDKNKEANKDKAAPAGDAETAAPAGTD